MNIRQERLAHVIHEYVSKEVLIHEQMHDHDFGIISILGVNVSADYSYADISVMSQKNDVTLPKFLAPLAKSLKNQLIKDYKIWKIPELRFRIDKKERNANDVLTLIHTLDAQYGLSREDH